MSIRLFKTPQIVIVGLFATCITHAARVIEYNALSEILITENEETESLGSGTNVCVYRHQARIACGTIVESKDKFSKILIREHTQTVDRREYDVKRKKNYFVELKFINEPIENGYCVDLKQLASSRTPCSKEIPIAEVKVEETAMEVMGPPAPPELATPKVVQLEEEKKPEVVVESVFVAPPKAPLLPIDEPELTETFKEVPAREPAAIKPANSNLSIGVNYVFPELHFQHRFSEHFSLGISSLLVNYLTSNSNTLKGYGGMFTVNYYQAALFEGMWLQSALGLFQMTASNVAHTEQLTLPGGSFLLGWHWKWENGLNFGMGAGGQYLLNAKASDFDLGFSGFWPAIVLELGFCL